MLCTMQSKFSSATSKVAMLIVTQYTTLLHNNEALNNEALMKIAAKLYTQNNPYAMIQNNAIEMFLNKSKAYTYPYFCALKRN